MKLDKSFLRSKVARRIFLLFIVCAVVPITILGILSFWQVTNQLQEQSLSRLKQASKAYGMSLFERLELLEHEIKLVGHSLDSGAPLEKQEPLARLDEKWDERFLRLAILKKSGERIALWGDSVAMPALAPADQKLIAAGKTVLLAQAQSNLPARVFLLLLADAGSPNGPILVGELNARFLWGAETASPQTETCVLNESHQVLFQSRATPPSFLSAMSSRIAPGVSDYFQWQDGQEEFLASYWSLFLKERFHAPAWTVVISESRSDTLRPLFNFQRSFPLVLLMALWLVLFLSLIQIRRSLVPLERLREGTLSVASGKFESKVTVSSGDEFQELAESFNHMAGRLGRQFNTLVTMNEIHQSILAALDPQKIVSTVLARMKDVIPGDSVSISLLHGDGSATGSMFAGDPPTASGFGAEQITLAAEDLQMLRENRSSLLLEPDGIAFSFLAPLAASGLRSFLVLPIWVQDQLRGIITVGYRAKPDINKDDLFQARRVADQVEVALSNARLLEDLRNLNWGTLTALARAIDAKSPWTSGHSERVTKYAIMIGQNMGLTQKELDILHRGGLLHDIGKIGIPAQILDKPGKLTDEELNRMRQHVRIGVRILEPIPGFNEILPIVLQHHEWHDGSGYPDGAAGENIHLYARIFAVADVFDALRSDRPYRAGLALERVVDYIQQKAGSQFNPEVVQAFLRALPQMEAAGKTAEVLG